MIKNFMEAFNFDDMVHGSGRVAGNPLADARLNPSFGAYKRASVLISPSGLTSPLRQFEETTKIISPRQANLKQMPLRNASEKQLEFALAQKAVAMLKKQRIIGYFYNDNPNYKTHLMFVDSFLVINALKGLSNMIAASKTEDEFGIVQQNLTDIITTFVELLKVYDLNFVTFLELKLLMIHFM